MQSHLSENTAEVAWVRELFPAQKSYLDVYAHYGLTGPRTIYGARHPSGRADFACLHESGNRAGALPDVEQLPRQRPLRPAGGQRAGRPVRVALATDLGGGTHFSMLRTMQAAYEVAQMSASPLPPSCALYLATRGAAHALDLDDRIGSVAPGMEADVIVLDLASTPLIDFRMRCARDFDETLAIQMALGDDRAIRATLRGGAPGV